MIQTRIILLVASLASLGSPSFADTRDAPESPLALGLGVVTSFGGYVGQHARVIPVPIIDYAGTRMFVHGPTAGVHMYGGASFALDGILTARFDGIDAGDLSESALAARGIDRAALDDRDDAVDAGVLLTMDGTRGAATLELATGVTAERRGARATAGYEYAFEWYGTSLSPHVRLTWLSAEVANYRYGIGDAETRRGVTRYEPGESLVGTVGASVVRGISGRWFWMAEAHLDFLGRSISESPLVEDRVAASLMLCIVRRFR